MNKSIYALVMVMLAVATCRWHSALAQPIAGKWVGVQGTTTVTFTVNTSRTAVDSLPSSSGVRFAGPSENCHCTSPCQFQAESFLSGRLPQVLLSPQILASVHPPTYAARITLPSCLGLLHHNRRPTAMIPSHPPQALPCTRIIPTRSTRRPSFSLTCRGKNWQC